MPPGTLGRFSEWLRDVACSPRATSIHIRREPAQLSDATVQPVLFTVLFVYIFGAAMRPSAAAPTRTSPSADWSR